MAETFTREQFSNPVEELSYLRRRIDSLEQEITVAEQETPTYVDNETQPRVHERAAMAALHEYVVVPPEEVLAAEYVMPRHEVAQVVLDLPPESHDQVMADLMQIMQTRGIRNALQVAEAMNNAHLEDDFHRFVIEYLRSGYPVPEPAKDFKEGSESWNLLHMTLYTVTIPAHEKNEQERRPLKEILSAMEQLYAGLLAVWEEKHAWGHFTIEVAVANNSEEIAFYVSVPTPKKGMFEKQIASLFPHATFVESHNDYNIFIEDGVTVGAKAHLHKEPALPIKTYDEFTTDPMQVLLNAFSHIERTGAGAAVQILVEPAPSRREYEMNKTLDFLRRGEDFYTAYHEATRGFASAVAKEVFNIFSSGSKSQEDWESAEKQEEKELRRRAVDQVAVEMVTKKIATPLTRTSVRLLVSAQTTSRAHTILDEITASFRQLSEGKGNGLDFTKIEGRGVERFTHAFSFRAMEHDDRFINILSLGELTALMHLPIPGTYMPTALKQASSVSAGTQLNLSEEGILLGVNRFQGTEHSIHFSREDRLRHFYVIGQTGTGKTAFLKNMIVQDIENGDGVCFIDPHGSDVQDVLALVPDHRLQDVIYFDPSNLDSVMGLNLLEYDHRFPEQKTFVVNELLSIFKKLYGAVPESMGPAFEQYFRNATMLVLEDPASGSTLLDVQRVLADARYRAQKLALSQNPVVNMFWQDIASKAQGEASLANIVPYITNKFDVFIANEYMRPIIAQEHSAFNFRALMDEKKILLVNLAKGRLGDINANLIGLILVGKILMAALSRVDSFGKDLAPFYLYIDEFQNITTDSISTILSEARKYKLSLTVAHQYIAQLDENIRDAVFGNVGSICSFRVGSDDAKFLEPQIAPTFSAPDIMNIDNYNAVLRLLVKGKPSTPFTLSTLPPGKGDSARIEYLKQLSNNTYGRNRIEVDTEIRARYKLG